MDVNKKEDEYKVKKEKNSEENNAENTFYKDNETAEGYEKTKTKPETKIETEKDRERKDLGEASFHERRAKRRRKNLVRTVVLAAVFFFVFLFYRYGWKYMGFQMTTDPSYIQVYNTGEYLPGNYAFVSGNSPMNIGSYAGSVVEFDEETKTLYVGIRFNLWGRNSEFRVEYPQDKSKVNKIVLKKNDIEREIWVRNGE